jgi:hypothetical protein
MMLYGDYAQLVKTLCLTDRNVDSFMLYRLRRPFVRNARLSPRALPKEWVLPMDGA